MSYELSDVEILFIIFLSTKFGISILLAAITLTISKKVNKTANRWFTVFILGLSFVFLIDVLEEHNYNFVPRLLLFFTQIPDLLIPISLYLAVKSFVNPIKNSTRNDVILFVPWVIDIVFKFFAFFIYKEEFMAESTLQSLYGIIFIAFWIFIVTKSWLIILKHQQSIKHLSADILRIDLKWLLYLLAVPTILILLR